MNRVMHVITTLDTGGAEIMLHRLLSRMDRTRFESEVVCLAEPGPVAERISFLGVEITSLRMRRGAPDPRGIARLVRRIRARRPDVIQSWMYHADLVASLAARLAGGPPVIWGIHNSTLAPESSRRTTRAVVGLLARLSHRIPARVVSCAEFSRTLHVRAGYDPTRMVTIPNGFDLDEFLPDPTARPDLRAELGVPPNTPLVGVMARYHPQKDHRNFVRAAGILGDDPPGVHYVLCGDGIDMDNGELTAEIERTGIPDRFHLLGRRSDMCRIMAAMDVVCSSSAFGEAFPLVIGEAMASGVPCVVTDVGDSVEMVGKTGALVPPRDPEALAAALRRVLRLPAEERERLGGMARARIRERYALEAIARRYERLYEQIIENELCAA